MEIKYHLTYIKDIKKLKPNFKLIAKNIEIELLDIAFEDVIKHPKITLMVGNNNEARYKTGDWRLGFYIEIINGRKCLVFSRFLNRKDIYKYFPDNN